MRTQTEVHLISMHNDLELQTASNVLVGTLSVSGGLAIRRDNPVT
jgi:hypothetical protein